MCDAQRFERDTRDHRMTVLRDDGVYRHLRFMAPDTSEYWYDLVTWPGRLAICGDMGDYVFAHTHDMFSFFARSDGGINPYHWGEKLRGPTPGRAGAKAYSHDALRAAVMDWARDEVENGGGWGDGEMIYPSLLFEAVEREILYGYTDAEHEGRERLELLEDAVGSLDCWEWDLRDFDSHYLWCCRAIVKGIEHYRASKAAEGSDDTREEGE